ncbi:hypothetical protein F2P56_027971 [Juglans regia]|uniref:Uncharacterized protein n=2 Tax=Juglans regia TaxID=51240 RepID=A0A833WZG3_JUGRE|nr:uncharacterized protein LOC109007838 [Juglans regia]KAF5453024.1 hypothetical protein F2P56_027971 [Juglans regia]
MMRRVVVVVYFAMLVLVLVAQAHQFEESSSSTGQLAPISSVASLPGDEGKSKPPAPGRACDGIYTCPAKCWVFRHDPKHYVVCVELCKKHCKDGGPALSDDIYTCTLACADSMPTRQLDSDHAVGGDYVETCFQKCKKNR